MSGGPQFPPNPTVGQLYTFGTTTWQWNGTQWVNATAGQNFLPLAGGTLTGALTLAGPGTAPNGAATVAQVNSAPYAPQNYVDNSMVLIAQRGLASPQTVAAGVYVLDRWKAGASGMTISWAANTAGPGNVVTITAGSMLQIIEAVNLGAQPYMLSWQGTATGRAYASGSPSGAYVASPIAVSPTTGTNWVIEFQGGTLTAVQLQVGTVATPWKMQPFMEEFARCQRHYQTASLFGGSCNGPAATTAAVSTMFNVFMRGTPTLTIYANGNLGLTGVSTQGLGYGGAGVYGTAAANTAWAINCGLLCDADL